MGTDPAEVSCPLFELFFSSNPLLLISFFGEIKIAHFTYEEASFLYILPLPWFQILSFRFGNF
jgi:hypothetical protein